MTDGSPRSSVLRQFGWLLLILTCSVTAAAAQQRLSPLVYADDFAALSRRVAGNSTPIMLVFTLPDCPYCARAKKDHLEALNAGDASKVILREIEAGNDALALRDFAGSMTTHREFARKYEVRAVPTVIVVDGAGKPLAEAIVGLTLSDFYGLYLEQAIEAARLQLRAR